MEGTHTSQKVKLPNEGWSIHVPLYEEKAVHTQSTSMNKGTTVKRDILDYKSDCDCQSFEYSEKMII